MESPPFKLTGNYSLDNLLHNDENKIENNKFISKIINVSIDEKLEDSKYGLVELTKQEIQNEIYQKVFQLYCETFDIDIYDSIKFPEEDKNILIENTNYELFRKLKPHFDDINEKLSYINNLILPEQRTPEWMTARMELISASDNYRACGLRGVVDYMNFIFNKIGIYMNNDNNNNKFKGYVNPMIHGTICELITQTIYEIRYNVKLKEYGCIPHKNISFIGASPDGIVNNVNDPNDIKQMSLLGRMIEIKNPFSRIIDEIVKPDYQYQIIQQQEVCELPLCDFIESNICRDKTYQSLNDMLNDKIDMDKFEQLSFEEQNKFIQNYNIPIQNLASDGYEKGILLHFYKLNPDRDSHIGVLYPLNKLYKRDEILTWLLEQRAVYEPEYTFNATFYWKLKEYNIKTLHRNEEMWNNDILPKLNDVWNIVLKNRSQTDEELLQEYSNYLEKFSERQINNKFERKLKKKFTTSTYNRNNTTKLKKTTPTFQFSSPLDNIILSNN
jgi:hypothetical protein